MRGMLIGFTCVRNALALCCLKDTLKYSPKCFGNLSQLCANRTYTNSSRIVLGIETSCDETGVAIVNEHGDILGEALNSQHQVHLDNGGIIPYLARDLHRENIANVVTSALRQSGLSLQDVSAVATTVKPGLAITLLVGLAYGKQLVKEGGKPFIPIHHMEAHSLVVRMVENVEFPFLVMLASGGHCQIAVVKNVEEFLLLGTAIDDAPGEAFDKIARRLKLKNLPECSKMNGGQAVEFLARSGDPLAFNFPSPLYKYRDCNFSFSGLKFIANKHILQQEREYGIEADGIIPTVADYCASFQYAVTAHIIKRLQRAMEFCERTELLQENHRTLVFSGGVACNNYIRSAISKLCDYMGYNFACPPPKLCTDNGIMIAWNGMEKLKMGVGIAPDPEAVDIDAKCPLGVDMTTVVRESHIKVKTFKFHDPSELTLEQSNLSS